MVFRLPRLWLLALPLILQLASCTTAPPLRDSRGRIVREGLAELEMVKIGGDDQWISIRGQDRSAPILLFLHGGPGDAEIPLTRHFLSSLEDEFIVVNWDQRGAGKSFAAGAPEKMHIDQFVQDTAELTRSLLKRFGQDKIYLMGHSWGTLLGVLAVTRYPELYFAYGGIGQFVVGTENESIGHRYAVEKAREAGNAQALAELAALKDYPPSTGTSRATGRAPGWLDELRINRKWVAFFGGALAHKTGYESLAAIYLGAPEYNLSDIVNCVRGDTESTRRLWPEIMTYDLRRDARHFEIPVFFFLGRHDYTTPWELSARYFDLLDAPQKRLYWFDNSAHCPNFEEPEAFTRAVRESFRAHQRDR
jgi:pimeloyl-ACP methyl ester carboxylesterase